MTEMTLTLNKEFIHATQCTNRYRGVEGAVRCTADEHFEDDKFVATLTPVPAGLEVFGTSCLGVLVQGGKYQEMNVGDWYLLRHGETQGIILDDATFKYVFRNELGA